MAANPALERQRELAIALKRLQALENQECFDPKRPNSRPTELQKQALDAIETIPHRYILGGNQSGKSMLCGREGAWLFTNTHPTFVRPERWGKGPLTLIIIGRTMTQVEEELWDNKIKPFLVEGEYHETRQGSILHKVVHNPTGNRILFFSHHSPDEAREKMQAYLAHWLWLDEMPTSFKLMEELHRRCQSYGGRFIASFTPKAVSSEIRKVVDAETPYQKVYRLPMLDNPINRGREEELVASMAGLPEDYRRTLLEGTWYLGDMAVYKFSEAHSIIKLPHNYQQSWRHVQAVDPAASSTAGHVLLAENPATGRWVVIRADYLKGASARELLAFAERSTFGVNIVKRVCDPAASWFMKHAQEDGYRFVGVYKKNERKKELIKNLQEALDNGLLQICDGLQDLINEFTSCQWSETAADKIIGARRFHLLDALQYAIDNLPQQRAEATYQSYEQWLRQSNKKRLLEESASKNQPKHKPGRIVAKRGKVVYRGPNTTSYNSR